VILAGFTGVHQFCKIGSHAFIGNNTAVTRDVPPYIMAVGHPAEPHSVNGTGLSRRGFSADQVRNIKQAFRTLYRSELTLDDALVRLREAATTQPEIQPMIDFIGRSTRSIIR
jgi:UDP-N-acetylglucosamine acyltransferase